MSVAKTVKITRIASAKELASCSGCPGAVIRWDQRTAHTEWHAVNNTATQAPVWADEFSGTDLSWATNTGGGSWRTKPPEAYGDMSSGYPDYASSSFNCTQAQAKQYGLITVKDSVLSIKAMRNPGIPGIEQDWLSMYLVTNNLPGTNSKPLMWRTGYFEIRARFTVPARGMFPAIWLFNSVPNRTDGKQGAEIDILEIFGNPTAAPWAAGVHWNTSGIASGLKSQGIYTSPDTDDTMSWHRYGVDWTDTSITIYKDGVAVGEITGEGAKWFATADLGIRLDLVMDPNWVATTAPTHSTPNDPAVGVMPQMDVDYVRVYATKPLNLPTAPYDLGANLR